MGPGDPELMTLKAVNILKSADVVFLPSAPKENCRVYIILKAAMPDFDEEKIVCVDTDGMNDPKLQGERYDILAEHVSDFLDKGKTVAFPALGEVSLYSTYMYVCERLMASGYRCENVSGISSVQETVNRLNKALAEGDDQVHVFPDTKDIQSKLSMPGTKLFMKPKGNLPETVKIISEYIQSHPETEAFGISNCGTDKEIIAKDISSLSNLSGYMSVIIVK